jgi:hypothetical protein
MNKAPLGGGENRPEPHGPRQKRREAFRGRSVLCDAAGIPLAVVIDGANRHDMKLAEPTLDALVIERPKPREDQPQGVCLDKGYDYYGSRSESSQSPTCGLASAPANPQAG